MSAVLTMALVTAQRLGPVFPCAPKAKEPFGRLAPHGCKDATRDEATIRSWFRRASTLNLALAFELGLCALDIDPRNGGDDELAALEAQHGPLPLTPRALTGGGGLHFLFTHDPSVRLRNGAIAPGVEVKAHGGYILVAPSVHPSGGVYAWDLGALPSETPIAPAPAWLVELARDRASYVSGPPVGPVAESFFGVAFTAASWIGRPLPDGKYGVRCPWAAEHSDGRGFGDDSSAALLPPTSATRLGGFRCTHAHCSARTTSELVSALPADAVRAALAAYPNAIAALRRRAGREVTQ